MDQASEPRLRYTDALNADYRALYQPCRHERNEARVFTTRDGRKQVWNQCLTCGQKVGQALKVEDKSLVPPADTDLVERERARLVDGREAIQRKHLALQQSEDAAFWVEYDKYLLSDKWREIRKKVLRRCDGVCEGCHDADAVEVHHKTYDHVFDELLFELVGLCKSCHDRCHDSRS